MKPETYGQSADAKSPIHRAQLVVSGGNSKPIAGLVAAASVSLAACTYHGQFLEPYSDLIDNGESRARAVRIYPQGDRLLTTSSTIQSGDKIFDPSRSEQIGDSGSFPTRITVKSEESGSPKNIWTMLVAAAKAIEHRRITIFGNTPYYTNTTAYIADLQNISTTRFTAEVENGRIDLTFLFDDNIDTWRIFHTIAHETYHAIVAAEKQSLTKEQIQLTGAISVEQNFMLNETAANLFGRCVAFDFHARAAIAFDGNIQGEGRNGTVSDATLLYLISPEAEIEMRYAAVIGDVIFRTIWSSLIGPAGYATRDDKGVERLLSLCTAEHLKRPENLLAYLRTIASDGIDAPDFPEKFDPPPESWTNYAASKASNGKTAPN